MLQRRLLIAALVVVVPAAAIGLWWLARPTGLIQGHVVDVAGQPLAGIAVTYSGGGAGSTDANGDFSVASPVDGGWVTAVGAGYLSRTRAARAGDPVLIRLYVDDGETIRLLFGGDVMFGRRFYDSNDDGDRSDGLLQQGATVEDHERLLHGIEPLLADADLTIVNLETPLIADPWVDPTQPRPSRFHPTKEFVFGSAPESAAALRRAGVDIVGLGNNHLYDALDEGVTSTREALLAAGYSATDFAGAGRTVDEAWQPAIREVAGQRVAVVACTTITGVEHPVTYVATATKAGSAECADAPLEAAIRSAATQADFVVAMIHGGFEYVREPSDSVSHFTAIAHQAGAAMVVDHHPHVVGGLASSASSLTAWTMGNLLFDQTVWPTFGSYVLRVDVRRGAVVDAYLEPIMLRDYQPVGVVGERANWVAREAQSLSDGPWVVDDGALMLAAGTSESVSVEIPAVTVPSAPTTILDLQGACLSAGASLPGMLTGRDEAWTGDFEDATSDEARAGGALWNVAEDNPDRQLMTSAAARGAFGVRLKRTGADTQEIILSPLHRLLVRAGDPISVLLTARGTSGAPATLQMSWYNDTIGPSQARSIVTLPVSGDWQQMRVDLVVPENGVAAQPFIRLTPPPGNQASIDVDDVRVIIWHTATARPACEFVRLPSVDAATGLTATVTRMPGSTAVATPAWFGADILAVEPVAGLPVGPAGSGWGTTE
ncbi:MAG: CapA family protein [Candidatus Limnocylindrales bacterium]